jgi:hypothetical protein
MMKNIKNISVKDLCDKIIDRLTEDDIFNKVLMAYNQYQEDERFGVDYIFDLDNQEDLKTLVKCGVTAAEISRLYNDKENADSNYLYCGENHTNLRCLNMNELFYQLTANMEEIVLCMLAYPYIDGYTPLYQEFVTNYIVE